VAGFVEAAAFPVSSAVVAAGAFFVVSADLSAGDLSSPNDAHRAFAEVRNINSIMAAVTAVFIFAINSPCNLLAASCRGLDQPAVKASKSITPIMSIDLLDIWYCFAREVPAMRVS
jgi:hypothetical protein